MINVCLTIDDKFTEYCATTITSVLENSKADLHFYIISGDLTPDNRDRLMSLRKLRDCDISIVTLEEKRVNQLKEYYVPPKSHFNYANYIRLMTPSLLSVDKIIYLDSDLIVMSDLKELWNIPQEDAYVLGSKSMTSKRSCKQLG
ncbi:MAG: glycosyltransferase family 8 protein, partial [Candidatus Heimdallarchaeaceae archaeon]